MRLNSEGGTMNEQKKLEKFLKDNYLFRLNEINGIIEAKDISDGPWDELMEFDIFRQLKLEGFKVSMNSIIYTLKSNFVKRYNAFDFYFKSLSPWTKEDPDYISLLSSHVRAVHQKRFNNHFKKWLVRTVKCALIDDYVNKNAILLVHEKQNSGKTTFIRFLVPQSLRAYYTENLSFDKDSNIALCENIIINLDELATFSRFEINQLKSILSKSSVKERHPFEKKAKRIPRRASFIGSTNLGEFLTDPTGNVRWIPFEIHDIDWNYCRLTDINDVWRQAYHLFLSSFPCDITAEEIKENEEANNEFLITTPEMELILKYYTPGTKENHDVFRTTTEIEMALREETHNSIKISNNQLGRALNLLKFPKDNRYKKEECVYPQKAYYINFKK
jgi:predicted P-loop ATPase